MQPRRLSGRWNDRNRLQTTDQTQTLTVLTPRTHERSPDVSDPHTRWLTVAEQLLSLFARLDVDHEDQPSALQDSVDTDALNALAGAPTTTVSFELWGHWVRIMPDVIELYAPDAVFPPETDVEGARP